MKNWMMALVLLSVNSACHKDPVPSSQVGRSPVVLQCLFPSLLTRHSERYQRFQERATKLELAVETKGGVGARHSFAPMDWGHIALPDLDFPKTPQDVLKIKIRVWDRTENGQIRDYAALSGAVQVTAGELVAGKATTIPVKLSLHVPVGEYD